MIKVSPSILAADFVNLERDIRSLAPTGADYVHIDVMDGLFVPNISIGLPVLSAIRKITDMTLDVHLMIDRPVRYVERFCDAGADILTVHLEADTPENTLDAIRRIRARGVRPAVCIKPKTPAEAVLPYLELVDLILVMTVEPGFGGQSFIPETMESVRALDAMIKSKGYNIEIEVDGGISSKTIREAYDAGARVFVAGSSVFKSDSPAAAIADLRRVCE